MYFKKRMYGARFVAMLLISCTIAGALLLGPVRSARSADAPTATVTVISDGQQWDYASCQATVADVLKEAGVSLGEKDLVYPKLSAKTRPGLRIRVIRVTEKVVVQAEPIKFKTVVKFDPIGAGERTVIRKGQPGEKEVKYRMVYKDGVKVRCSIIGRRATKKPVNEVVAVSRSAFLSSRAGSYMRSLRMVATAYDPYNCGGSGSGRTASGMRAGKGVVAVDPRIIPLGTKLYVGSYGFCVAGDTGGAIKGLRIDLGFNSYGEALHFGRRIVTVYILE